MNLHRLGCPFCWLRRLFRRDHAAEEALRTIAHGLGIGVLIGAQFAHLFTPDGNACIRRRDLPAAVSLLRLLAVTQDPALDLELGEIARSHGSIAVPRWDRTEEAKGGVS
jgi:hypothetical protein